MKTIHFLPILERNNTWRAVRYSNPSQHSTGGKCGQQQGWLVGRLEKNEVHLVTDGATKS